MTLMQRRRVLMGAKSKDLPILNPAIGYTENTIVFRSISPPYLASQNGVAATDFIYTGAVGNFVYYNPADTSIAPNGNCGNLLLFNATGDSSAFQDWWNCGMAGAETSVSLAANKQYVRLNLSMEKMSQAYAYNSATGKVYYAGKDSPYYGKNNIND